MLTGAHTIIALLLIVMVCLIPRSVLAQDLAKVGKKNGFTWSGGLSAYSGFYSTDLSDPRQVPLTWGISGNVNIRIYDLNIPVSFIFTERERSFRQPFNEFGASPRYKWATLHLGYRSMNFSKLTLGGHRFKGAGIELKPGKFNFSGMYGQLRREVVADTTQETIIDPSYDRFAMAGKFSFGKDGNQIGLILFQAEDRFDARDLSDRLYGQVAPEENLVGGLNYKKRIAKVLRLNIESALSFLNVGDLPQNRTGEFAQVSNDFDSFLFNMDVATQRGTAVKTSLTYSKKGFTLGAKYDRISPFFRTLGNYYFMNDQENLRGQLGFNMLKRKVTSSFSFGIQRNDLAKVSYFRTVRTIGSANVNINSGKAYSATLNYSNFEADMRSAIETYGSDSIQFNQVSQNVTFNQNLKYKNKDKGRSDRVSVATTYQSFGSSNNDEFSSAESSSITASISFSRRNRERKENWRIRFTNTIVESATVRKNRYGLSLSGRKRVGKSGMGVNSRLGTYLNRASNVGNSMSVVFNLGLDQKLAERHTLRCSLGYTSRGATELASLRQYQIRGRVGYSLSLSPKKAAPSNTGTK